MRKAWNAVGVGKVAILLAAQLALCAAARAQKSPDPEGLFAEARPHFEAALGARLQRLPQFRTVTPAELAEVGDGLLDRQLRWQYPDLGGPPADDARRAALRALRSACVAAQQEGTDVIFFAPDNAAVIARTGPALAKADSESFLRLALVKEAARWVLDHRYELAKRRAACRDSEELIALQVIIEGRAGWIAREVARRMSEVEYFPLLAEAYTAPPEGPSAGAAAVLGRDVRRRRGWACVLGLAFFDYLEHQGVTDAEARAFLRPPRQLSRIERPELYLRAERLDLPDLGDALARVEKALSPAEWQAGQQPWTPDMIRRAATLLGETRRMEKVAQAWDAGRSLVWSARDNPGRQVVLGVVRFQDEAAARSYYGLAVDLQRRQDELFGGGPAGAPRLLESRSQPLTLPGLDEAVRCDRRVGPAGKGREVAMTQVCARAGDRVVELTWYDAPADAEWAARVLDEVLKGR
jgi:hypothetical protein